MPSVSFQSHESKLLNSMFDQTVKQFAGAKGANKQAYEIMLNLNDKIKKHKGKKINLSQIEHQFLKKSLQESISATEKQMLLSWFGKRWLMKIALKQYKSILQKLNLVIK